MPLTGLPCVHGVDDRSFPAHCAPTGRSRSRWGPGWSSAPGSFFSQVGPFGVRNDHYLRDVATWSFALGVLALLAAARPAWRLPVLALAAVQSGLHAVNHVVDAGDADPSWIGAFDAVSLGLLTVTLARPRPSGDHPMKVLIAGATGAIGRPLVDRLVAEGHDVAALTRSEDKAAALRARGVEAHVADVFDRDGVIAACRAAAPEVVVHQLTALPKAMDIRKYREALEPTNRLRLEATPHLIAGAQEAGARRIVVQSISFITAPEGPSVHDEDAPVYADAPAAFRGAVAATAAMERATLGAGTLDPVVLRYGFFYGPGTYFAPGGATVKEIEARRFPIVGRGTGTSSFLHIADAVDATTAALDGGASGLYNVCDDDPAPMADWLPHAAAVLGARPPRRVPAFLARLAAGSHAVHFATTLRGNDNARFKATFGWSPKHPSWRDGFRTALIGAADADRADRDRAPAAG